MQIGINLPPGQGHEQSTSVVKRSKVKVTGGRTYVWKPGGDNILDPLSRVDRDIQGASEMLLLEGGGVLRIVLAAPPRLSICVLLTHLLNMCLSHLRVLSIIKNGTIRKLGYGFAFHSTVAIVSFLR